MNPRIYLQIAVLFRGQPELNRAVAADKGVLAETAGVLDRNAEQPLREGAAANGAIKLSWMRIVGIHMRLLFYIIASSLCAVVFPQSDEIPLQSRGSVALRVLACHSSLPFEQFSGGRRFSRSKYFCSRHPRLKRADISRDPRARIRDNFISLHYMDQTFTKQKIKELRGLVADGDRVGILLQDDPDPDAMSTARARRPLLGRNNQTTPLFSLKPVTRP